MSKIWFLWALIEGTKITISFDVILSQEGRNVTDIPVKLPTSLFRGVAGETRKASFAIVLDLKLVVAKFLSKWSIFQACPRCDVRPMIVLLFLNLAWVAEQIEGLDWQLNGFECQVR